MKRAKWRRTPGRESGFYDLCIAPAVRATVWVSDDGEVRWYVNVNHSETVMTPAPSVRSAKRAAERWVETFARELLIGLGKESP